jgi:hypothetical protein
MAKKTPTKEVKKTKAAKGVVKSKAAKKATTNDSGPKGKKK